MRRGGFTLLETMIVVLIVTAISAIFLPSLAARATASRLGQASRAIESGAALAGARAMERGVIIAYVAEAWGDEWVLWAEEVAPGEVGALLKPAEMSPEAPPEEDGARRVELASFEGVELTDTLPPAEDELLGPEPLDDAAMDEGAWSGEAALYPEVRERHVLGVFFADGSCRVGPTVYLISKDGDREVIHLRPLTGRVDSRRLPRVSEELEQMERAGDDQLPLPAEDAGGSGGGP